MRITYVPMIIAVLVLLAAPANASIPINLKQKVVQLIEAGKPRAAHRLLESQLKVSPRDWFLYGVAARKAGHLKEAEHAFRTVLRLEPISQRARLELATVLGEQGNWSESRRLLLDVKAANPPAQVTQNIDRYLALLDEQEAKQRAWRVRTTAGFLYDSNVNSSTKSDTVEFFGLPFTLSDDAREQSDFAYTVSLEADHLGRIVPGVSWQSNISFNWTDYFELDSYDTAYLSASTGPVLELGKRTIVSLPVTGNVVSYTDQGDLYSTSVGIAPQVRYKATNVVDLNLSSRLARKHFLGNGDRDITSYSISTGVDIRTCGQGTLRFVGTLGRDDSGIDTYSNDNWELNTSLFCPLGSNLAGSVFGSYGEADYDEREFVYPEARSDRRTKVGANLQYAHQPTGLDVLFGVTYWDNDSNLTLYTYDKLQISSSVRKKF